MGSIKAGIIFRHHCEKGALYWLQSTAVGFQTSGLGFKNKTWWNSSILEHGNYIILQLQLRHVIFPLIGNMR